MKEQPITKNIVEFQCVLFERNCFEISSFSFYEKSIMAIMQYFNDSNFSMFLIMDCYFILVHLFLQC